MLNKRGDNLAFIDGQNLDRNTRDYGWMVDLKRFRVYLAEKYKVTTAYYFIGSVGDEHQKLYQRIQKAGFILVFRAHSQGMKSKKKGNVDTDIVFSVMQAIADGEEFDNVILVSGDGDYFRMVSYLIEKGRFGKLLAPNRKSTSSLYRMVDNSFIAHLDEPGIKQKIRREKHTK